MSQLLASPVATPESHPLTTAQVLRGTGAAASCRSAAPTGVSLHQFTEAADRHLEMTPVDLHRVTTILSKQIKLAFHRPDTFTSVRALVTDPNRVATADGRSALELCGQAWHPIQSDAAERADAAIDGVERFGEATVIKLAALRATQCQVPWWGTPQWEDRIDAWARTIRFASRLKRTARDSPELIADDVLYEIIAG